MCIPPQQLTVPSYQARIKLYASTAPHLDLRLSTPQGTTVPLKHQMHSVQSCNCEKAFEAARNEGVNILNTESSSMVSNTKSMLTCYLLLKKCICALASKISLNKNNQDKLDQL